MNDLGPHVATIALRGLRVHGRHGALPEETVLGQEFLIDAELQVDTRRAAEGDDLTATADYGRLAARLTDVVAGPPVALLERLVELLLDVCLADPAVAAATVTVHKPGAPIPLPFGDVTVTSTRYRPGVLSLGSNVGDRLGHLQAAVDLLRAFGLRAVSPVYETDPVGGPDQAPVPQRRGPGHRRRATAAAGARPRRRGGPAPGADHPVGASHARRRRPRGRSGGARRSRADRSASTGRTSAPSSWCRGSTSIRTPSCRAADGWPICLPASTPRVCDGATTWSSREADLLAHACSRRR